MRAAASAWIDGWRSDALKGLILTALFGWSVAAHAAGFDSARFGGEHGTVTTTNATALYYNPAGIAGSSGTRLYLDGVVALRGSSWERPLDPMAPPAPAGAEGAEHGRAELFNLFGAPTFGVTTRVGELALGGAFFVPFGGRSKFARNDRFANHPDFPLAADGVQRWHGIDGALTFMYFTAGAAYRWGRLSVGLSANLVRSSVKNTRAINPTGGGEVDPTREGRVTLDVSGMQGSFGAGLLFEAIADRLWVAGSYQAPPGLGPMTLDGTLETTYQGDTSSFPVTLTQALPDVLRAGLRLRPSERVELRLSADLTRWSVMQSQCVSLEGRPCAVLASGIDATAEGTTVRNIRRRWRDSYGARLGASYWLRPALELFVGVGYAQGAVPDETLEPSLADANNAMAALGARFQIADTWSLQTSYTQFFYADRDNRGKSQLPNALLPTRGADGGGVYRLWLGLVQLSLEKQL